MYHTATQLRDDSTAYIVSCTATTALQQQDPNSNRLRLRTALQPPDLPRLRPAATPDSLTATPNSTAKIHLTPPIKDIEEKVLAA